MNPSDSRADLNRRGFLRLAGALGVAKRHRRPPLQPCPHQKAPCDWLTFRPATTYNAAVSAFGVQGVAETAYLVGCHVLIGSLLNTSDVNLPGTELG